MTTGLRCSECGAPNRLFDAMNGSVLAMTGEPRLPDALQRILDVARQLVGARFAAVGILGEGDRFAAWATSGNAGDGQAPPVTGALAHALRTGEAWCTADLASHGEAGAWPESLPPISSLLAVPIVADGEVLGAFYLGNEDGWGFAGEQRRMVEVLAPHAANAVANARLHERSRELSVLQERTRLARELHDSVTQALFSMRLAADTALATTGSDSDAARGQIERLRELAAGALSEMRALLAELRPPQVEAHGVSETLRNHVEVLRQVHGIDLRYEARLADRLEPVLEGELFRIAQEALANAVRHSGARVVDVCLEDDGSAVRLTVRDDGTGFDPGALNGRGGFGLTSMRERAAAVGAKLTISSAPDDGTLVLVEVPR